MARLKPQFYLVEDRALPAVLRRVLHAKSLIETGQCRTVAEAVSQAGLSRSVFHKYRDAVSPFSNVSSRRIATFHILMENRKGALSAVLDIFSNLGANILTLNQSLPINGRAVLVLTAETHKVEGKLSSLTTAVGACRDVISVEVMAGGK